MTPDMNPEIVLFDEPLAALRAEVRLGELHADVAGHHVGFKVSRRLKRLVAHVADVGLDA